MIRLKLGKIIKRMNHPVQLYVASWHRMEWWHCTNVIQDMSGKAV